MLVSTSNLRDREQQRFMSLILDHTVNRLKAMIMM